MKPQQLAVGMTVYAINPCIMEKGKMEGKPSLTIGWSYKVKYVNDNSFYIIDDFIIAHSFPSEQFSKYFTTEQPQGTEGVNCSQQQIESDVNHIFESGANEIRVVNLITSTLDKIISHFTKRVNFLQPEVDKLQSRVKELEIKLKLSIEDTVLMRRKRDLLEGELNLNKQYRISALKLANEKIDNLNQQIQQLRDRVKELEEAISKLPPPPHRHKDDDSKTGSN